MFIIFDARLAKGRSSPSLLKYIQESIFSWNTHVCTFEPGNSRHASRTSYSKMLLT